MEVVTMVVVIAHDEVTHDVGALQDAFDASSCTVEVLS